MGQKQIGTLLLVVGAAGVLLAMMMDTSVSSGFGRVNNLGLMKDQQNYLLLSGLTVLVGLALLLFGSSDGESSGSRPLRMCPACAERIQPLAVKCRFCGTEVEPIKTALNLGSVDELSMSDLKNLAEFYSIQQVGEQYELQGRRYVSLAEAVQAARSGAA